MLLHQAVQRGLLGAVALVVDRGATLRPAGLPHRGLHALLISRLWCLRGLRPRAAPPWPLLAPTSGRPPQGVNALLELLAFMWAIAKKVPITAPAGDGQVPDGRLLSALACNVVGAEKDP